MSQNYVRLGLLLLNANLSMDEFIVDLPVEFLFADSFQTLLEAITFNFKIPLPIYILEIHYFITTSTKLLKLSQKQSVSTIKRPTLITFLVNPSTNKPNSHKL